MSNKLNKLVTNIPVTLTEQEVINLSETLSAVRTAGGGGEGGHTYLGDGTYIGVDNNNNKISFLSDAANKLESVTNKLDKSEFETASADFATKTELESYATKTELENYQTKGDYLSANALNSLSGTWETVTDKLDKTEFAEVSGDFLTQDSLAGYATETYVQTASAGITGWVNDQGYLKTVPNTYYLKTETSGKDELSAAFNDILKYNVTAAAGIEITTATDAGVKTFGISMTAEPVVTDTTLSGYNGIAAARDGEVNNQWNIGLTQDITNTINGKLDSSDFTTYTGTTAPNTYLTKTSADTLYQPTGDYVTTADVLTGTSNTLTGIKIGSTDYTIPTTDLSNYYTKTQVDSTFASASELNSYLTTAQYQTDSASFALKTDTSSKNELSTEFAKYTKTEDLNIPTKVSDLTDSADYAKKTDLDGFVTSSSDTITGTKQYALTTAGWAEVSTPTIPGITANNGLSANGHTVGISNNNIAANKQYAWTTTGWEEVSTPTIPAITAESGISADGYKIGLTTTAINAITSVSSKVDKPSSLIDKYLVLRTDNAGNVSGWCDFQDKSYSKSEALDTFVATANIDTTTLSGNGKSVSTKLGVKTDVIATTDYVNSSFLPLSGGEVSGSVKFSVASGQNVLAVASAASLLGASRQTSAHYGVDNTALGTTWMGVGGAGMHQGFIKYTDGGDVGALDSNSTIQVNLKPSTNNFDSVQVQINGNHVGYLIPAVTSTTTAGLTNDGILHIILES